MYIDIHTHAFHPKIAHKAVDHLNSFYSITCSGDGTIANLLEREQEAGLEKCVVLCAATAPAQVIPANNYAISLQREHPEQVIAFGTVHPAYENWEKELARLKAAGIRGIKLHPDFQSFWLDDPRLLPIFEAAQKDFVFEIHIGDKTTPDKNPSCPYKLASIMRQFPGIRVIAAHFGGYRMWSHALEVFSGTSFENLWFDTSSTTPFASPELAHKLLNTFPRERILFGTDWPLYDPVEELQRLQSLGRLSDSEMEVIMSNASALLAPTTAQLKSQHDH
jgi:predicted TIM-barrel fold metal-dependent hydrolase